MRIARSTGTMSGLLIAVLAIWGGLIPFIGPYFDYSFGSNTTWHYTTDRLWLDILPATVALIGGLLLLSAATRAAGIFGGWLAMLGGAWFAVGPAVSVTWEHGSGPIGRPLFGGTRQALELIGYFYGLGALIVALAAFCIGRFASRPLLAEQEAIAAASRRRAEPPAPVSARAPAAAVAPAAAATEKPTRSEAARAQTAGEAPAHESTARPAAAQAGGAAEPEASEGEQVRRERITGAGSAGERLRRRLRWRRPSGRREREETRR